MSERIEPMKFIVTIVERGQGAQVRRLFLSQQHQLRALWQTVGRGTASSELLDILGIGTPERDILFSLATGPSARRLFQLLKSSLTDHFHAKGILFSLPLTAVSGIFAGALASLESFDEPIGETTMDIQHSLILAIVNQGYTDAVMATAKAAGARGGTVLRARWAGDGKSHEIMGISVQEEKEILAIVTPQRSRSAIMDAITRDHGLKSDAQAILCCVGIEDMTRLG